jgi:hypothetical protein
MYVDPIPALERRLSFSQAARREGVHLTTVWRWTLAGAGDFKLKFWILGGRRFTSIDAIEEFIAARTAAATDEEAPVRTNRQHAAAQAAARKKLEAAGVL